ncbi:MAG TPA: hypothetical protein VFW33_16695 [Gemmataceae bacterium]|nr:hypothetical protein [Gemmataceae bacterium]
MSTTVTVQGTVKPDGTLELDEPLKLPAGRVVVTVRPVPPAQTAADFMALMERIWAMRPPDAPRRTKEEIDAEIAAFRDEFEEGFLKSERLHDEIQRAKGQTKPPEEAG